MATSSTQVETKSRSVSPGKLGLAACTALVIGNVIGSGVFLLPASLAPFGGLALVGWLVSCAGALLLAMVFAKLAQVVPQTGGPYAYTRVGFGDFTGYLIAWGYWIGIWSSVAAVAVALVSYASGLAPALNTSPALSALVAIGVVWFLTWVNLRGVQGAGRMQTITTVLKLIPLVAVGTIGLLWANWSNFAPTVPPQYPSTFSAIAAAASLTLFAFLGIESATVPAGDVDEPARTIPRATIVGTLIVAAVYILSTIGVMGALPASELAASPAPFADAARAMWGDWAYPVVIIGAVISCFGAINGFILLQGQVPFAAASDNLFPKRFARVSTAGVPAFGCVVSSALVSALLLINYLGQATGSSSLTDIYNSILLLATFVTLVPYAFCTMAELMIFILRRDQFKGERLRRASVIAVLAFIFSIITIIGSGAQTVLYGFVMLLLGVPIYVWLKRAS
ncbi:MAG TPA: amino acid permease, partial [Roseiflexaceae bacterium]|nr:amino acid permease [Roseiflexaceae bacterium]